MRTSRILLASFLLVSSVEAQNHNPIKIYDGTTEFTSRGSAGGAQVRLIQRLPGDAAAGAPTLTRVEFVMQDEDDTTQESYLVEVLADNGIGQPDLVGPALVSIGPLLSQTSGNGGRSAFTYTHDISPPLALGCTQTIYLSVQVPQNAAWPADGLSIHASAQSIGSEDRELPKGDPNTSVNLAWQEIGGTVSEPTGERCWDMGFAFDEVSLQPYAMVPAFTSTVHGPTPARAQDFGQAGRHPDIFNYKNEDRFDDFGFRAYGEQFRGTASPAILYLTTTNLGSCVPILTLGNLWVNPADPLFTSSFGTATLAYEDGNGVFTWGPFNPTRFERFVLSSGSVAFYAQAIVFDPVILGMPLKISTGTTVYF